MSAKASSGARNRKRALLGYCWAMCRWKGVEIEGKSLADMVEALSGQRLSKAYAYLWLEQSRSLGRAPAMPGEARPLPRTDRPPTKMSEDVIKSSRFYETQEWRSVRYAALKKHGANCQACGRNWREDGVKIHVDHIKPKSKFPGLALEITNLQVLCEDCNLGKSNRDATDWR